MTTKQKLPFRDGLSLARTLIEQLAPYCERIEAAGSVRRMKPEIGDIELVAIPKMQLDMFGGTTQDHSLDAVAWAGMGRCMKSGHKYKQVELHAGINLDLFIVTPPAQWGVIFTIRTGPAEFSHRIVTTKAHGGLLPSNFSVREGAVWNSKEMFSTPEEVDFFRLIGLQYIEPWDRK